MMTARVRVAVACVVAAVAGATLLAQATRPPLSSEARIARIDQALQTHVDDGRLGGPVALALKDGAAPSRARTGQAGGDTVFFDDFSTGTLDRSKWNVIVTGRTVNNEQQAYVDEPATIGVVAGDAEGATNGALEITARWRPGFTSAEGRSYRLRLGPAGYAATRSASPTAGPRRG